MLSTKSCDCDLKDLKLARLSATVLSLSNPKITQCWCDFSGFFSSVCFSFIINNKFSLWLIAKAKTSAKDSLSIMEVLTYLCVALVVMMVLLLWLGLSTKHMRDFTRSMPGVKRVPYMAMIQHVFTKHKGSTYSKSSFSRSFNLFHNLCC